jgi:UDP-glucose 4-epimerase
MTTVILGGAGFIGSHFVHRLLSQGSRVVVVDNFTSGKLEFLNPHLPQSDGLSVIHLDVEDTKNLVEVTSGASCIIHLASNPDIAKAATDPRVDFLQGTCLTESALEAARINGIPKFILASGSGVYGDAGSIVLSEESKLNPISTYGASKLAGESLLSAYCYMFGIQGTAFRFANVVGSRQTHGITYDLVSRLRVNQENLTVLGDGSQSKSYLHVEDVISGVLDLSSKQESAYEVFNLANDKNISVKEIVNLVLTHMGLDTNTTNIEFGNSPQGWKADVPIVRMDSSKARNRGWVPTKSSHEAISEAIKSRIQETISL